MSQENVEIVQRAFDAMNAFTRGEPSIGAFAEILGVKMEWPLRTRQRPGALGFVAWLEETRTPMHRLTFEPHEFIETGEHVVVPLTVHAVKRDGDDVPARVTWTWTIRDGIVARLRMYKGKNEALEDAGLRE